MDKLRCIVVDDEPLALKMLENYIRRTPWLELESSFNDPVAALSEIRKGSAQLVFLDIQMPDLSGMELSRMVPEGTRIIFTTAFAQYALESYDVSALDFLLKPVRYQKFLSAAEKARAWFSRAGEASGAASAGASSVFLKVEGVLRKVDFPEILYIEGMKDYVQVRLEGETRPLVTHMTMKGMEEMLPRELFMRVHRSYIVALDKISSVSPQFDLTVGGRLIHVGEVYRADFETWLGRNTVVSDR